jgi:glycosyltransferase involved in cell wall biosynthesis
MRIAQLILPGASHYERKSQRIDAAQLNAAGHVVEVVDGDVAGGPTGFDLAHIYGPPTLPRRRLNVPYVANAAMRRSWWQLPMSQPDVVVAPVQKEGSTLVPEAVDGSWFGTAEARDSGLVVGTFVRPSVKNVIEQTMHRLAVIRDDITWYLFDTPPAVEELSQVGAWLDPAIEGDDYDGFTAEALAAGLAVVATRTPINLQRADKGRSALLVPADDPNELTHAILAALFKPEVSQQRAFSARQTIAKFRPRQRLRVLLPLYETLLR